ncbi:MAG: dihydrodipicolinate synthase family protein [Clostridia bacterium]|nr:dihydrodipicolinate synthase family protein [Clostridia bacterium]
MTEKRFPRCLLCAACIPWTESGTLDVALFRQGVRLLCENGAGSIYLFGTAGEGYAVNREQYVQIVTEFMEEIKQFPQVIPMVGVISLSQSEIMERIRLAAALGVRDFQISFPSWGALSDTEAFAFLKTVCGTFPHYRFMHYNNALRSKKRLSPKDYLALTKEIPNLVAVKFIAPSFGEIQDFARLELPLRVFFLEYAYGFGSMVDSQFGFLASITNAAPAVMRAYYEAGQNKDWDTISQIHKDFPLFYDSLFTQCPGSKIDAAYDKLYLQFLIPSFPSRILPPYEGFSHEEVERFKSDVREKLPHWFTR